MSVVFTFVFNSTKGSLIAVMLLHGANNASWTYLHDVLPGVEIDDQVENLIVGALWVIIAIACVVLFGSKHLSRAPRQVIDFDAGTSGNTAPVEEPPKQV